MNSLPSPTGSNGRDNVGRFAPGNRFAKGNPFAQRVARLRSALFKAMKPADLTEVVAALLTNAKAGDVPAARELLQRVLGPPEAADLLDRLQTLERQIAELSQRRGSAW